MRFDLFSSGRLYTALEAAEYPDLPRPRTLQDWITNDSAPEGARQFVAQLLELDAKKEPSEPGWVRRLEARLIELRSNQDRVAWAATQKTIEALTPSELSRAADLLNERLEGIRQRNAEAPPETHDSPTRDDVERPAQ